MKVLFVGNLFPNCHEPDRGVFNLRQLTSLAQLAEVQVIAPIAWFPIRGRFTPPAPVPRQEIIANLNVYHPRQFYLPKIGRTLNPWLYQQSITSLLRRLHHEHLFEVIYVNWTYPDACGVAPLAQQLNLPFVVSVSGSDANAYLKMRLRRGQILTMLGHAAAITVRSNALKELLVSHEVEAAKIHTLYNGVDSERFRPTTREQARKALASSERTGKAAWLDCVNAGMPLLLYVGRLSPEKGVDDLLRATAQLHEQNPDAVRLLIVGDGAQREPLWHLAVELGLERVVGWVGRVAPDEVNTYLTAADLICLPSHMEGVPNVALEAFACGRPVVASRVGGIPEIMTDDTGVMTEPRNPRSLATAIQFALQAKWDETTIRQHAKGFDWAQNARDLRTVLTQAIDTRPCQQHNRGQN